MKKANILKIASAFVLVAAMLMRRWGLALPAACILAAQLRA